MALDKVKTKTSAKSGPAKGRWITRAEAKLAARKRRRREDKRVLTHERGCSWVVGPDHRCNCGLWRDERWS